MHSPSVVSLFCGAGGLDLGFMEQGFDLVYASDSDPAAVDCYARNLDRRVYCRDVQTDTFASDIRGLQTCDVVLGGFPCQGFSKAGPKRFDDDRNPLYLEMRNAISVLRPAIFIAENVDGLSQNFSGTFLERILDDFGSLNYTVEHQILDAAAFGLPQHRRRIFFVGVRQDLDAAFPWPVPTHSAETRNGETKISLLPTLWDGEVSDALKPPLRISDAISDLVELGTSAPDHVIVERWPQEYAVIMRHIRPGQKLCNVRHAPTSVYTWQIPEVFGPVSKREVRILETISKNRRHKEYGAIPNGNPLPIEEIERHSGMQGIGPEIESLLSKGYLKDMKGRYDLKGAMFCSGLFKRPRWNDCAPTVLTNLHNPRYFIHPLRDRPFSLRECARLQGFPDTFRLLSEAVDVQSAYRLVGNAVPPPLSRLLAAAVHKLLSQSRTEFIHEVA
jgi:DNA (cytosine-5)-methyltransferase 1